MNGLDLSYMKRIYTVSGVISIFVFVVILLQNKPLALSFLIGAIFGIVNMMLFERLIRASLHSGKRDPIEIAVTFLVKFPLALGFLFYLLWRNWVNPLGFLAGFPMILVGALTAMIGHYYFGSGKRTEEGERQ